MIWIIKAKNIAVTEYYFNILKEAADLICAQVIVVDSIRNLRGCKSFDLIIVGNIVTATKLFFRGYKNIIVWFQGVIPEESYLRNKSILRKTVLEQMEKLALKKSCLRIFVSRAMKEHYESKYGMMFNEDSYYIMPCFNTGLSEHSFFQKDKYKNNLFVYAGGLSSWQKFDTILSVYQGIEKLEIANTKLLILTPDKEKAMQQVEKLSIKNFEIDYLPVEELPSVLANAKFGFVIRDNSIINRVSTPTKLSTYISNGIIPIYSCYIEDFHTVTKEFQYKICFEAENFNSIIEQFMTADINPQAVYTEYSTLFEEYYNSHFHVENITIKFQRILKAVKEKNIVSLREET
jgi:hypothetical protein